MLYGCIRYAMSRGRRLSAFLFVHTVGTHLCLIHEALRSVLHLNQYSVNPSTVIWQEKVQSSGREFSGYSVARILQP
jgi:hypothetical protein